MSDLWIVVPNWDKFQHYRDRNPPWIKLYTELAHKDEWLGLTLLERGLLVSIWIEYALHRCALRAETVRSMVHRNWRERALNSLLEAGFIELSASKPLATRARAREETETETPKSPLRKPRPAKVTGWRLVRGTHGVTHIPDPEGTDRL